MRTVLPTELLPMQALLYLAFVLSGAAGLIYESIWSRYLGLFVGHSAYAQIIVLAIFLGGMSLGALLVGKRSERIAQPLVGYAVVEGIVGLMGLVFDDVYRAVSAAAYDTIFPALPGEGVLMTVVKWGLASALILPQAILLGATFPLMSAAVLRIAPARPGRVLALLYFANSLGAAGGVLIAGFWLLSVAGLPGTLLVAAILNLLVALVTYGVARSGHRDSAIGHRDSATGRDLSATAESRVHPPSFAGHPAESPVARAESRWNPARLLLWVSFGTAVASFIYEIAWIRMLSLVLGSATHSFELMLSAFILGLALGALWTHRYADGFRNPVKALGIVQLAMGTLALATLPLYLRSFEWTASLIQSLAQTDGGYGLFGLARYAFCLAVMLPATFCAGMTLPLITRTLLGEGHGERAIGTVYGVNTLGSIAGVVLASLVLMPLVGVKALLVLGAVVDMALGVLLLRAASHERGERRLVWGAMAAASAVVALAMAGNRFDTTLLTSGVYRHGRMVAEGSRDILFYRDGRTATVAVGRSRRDSSLFIMTNGKPDASLDPVWLRPPRPGAPRVPMAQDQPTQVLLPLMTLAHASGARSAAVIGQGSGMSSHMLLASPALERLVTIEIEPEMIAGSRLFYPANARVFDDPRSKFVIDDAKSFFAVDRRKYDLILSEPSNPWVSGVSGLFTTEFYGRVKQYLAEGGVLGQWLHLYELNDGLVLSVLAAIHQNFPAYEVFLTASGDMLILAANGPSVPEPDWSVFELPAVKKDLAGRVPFTARSLEATRLVARDVLAPLLDGWGQPNSDFFPVLDLGGERARFRRQSADGFAGLSADRFDVAAALLDRRAGFSDDEEPPVVGIPRLDAAARSAVLRADRAASGVDTSTVVLASSARYARWVFTLQLASSTPPTDWNLWMRDLVRAEQELHGGTAGVMDSAFYATVKRYVDRQGAPEPVRQALAFLSGIASWDFPAASRAADALVPRAATGEDWLPPDVLRDGAVVAKLRIGDREGARAVYAALRKRTNRKPTDVRSYLLAAHVSGDGHRDSPLAIGERAP
jgi:spermidine synthase